MATDESDEEWTCPNCGSTEPHNAITLSTITFPDEDRFEAFDITPDPEIEVDVTCRSVYFTFIDGSDDPGMAFTHDEFEQIIDLYDEATDS